MAPRCFRRSQGCRPLTLDPIVAVALTFFTTGLAGLTAGNGRRRMAVAGALLFSAAAIPWFVPVERSFLRALMAMFACFAVGRTADIFRQGHNTRVSWRVLHIFSLVDTRLLRRSQPTTHWAVLIRLAAFGAASWATLSLLDRSHRAWIQWLLGVAFVYALIEAVAALVRLALGWLGFRAPPLHEDPILSRSVREFWAERWNRVISRILATHAFIPLARSGHPGWGLFLSFLASGIGHAYFVWVAAGFQMAIWMLSFFLLQWLAVALESAWGVERWPSGLGRSWTGTFMLVTSPLFIVPALRCLGV